METLSLDLTKITYAFEWDVVYRVHNKLTGHIEMITIEKIWAKDASVAQTFAFSKVKNTMEILELKSAICTGRLAYAFDCITLEKMPEDQRQLIPIPDSKTFNLLIDDHRFR